MRMRLRYHSPVLEGAENQGIIRTGVQLGVNLPLGMIELIAAGAVYLRHRSQTERILGTYPLAGAQQWTVGQQLA